MATLVPHAAAAKWLCRLGQSFRPYDQSVQNALEAAFLAGDQSTRIQVRGVEYIVDLHEPRKQTQASDPTKTRAVQREGGLPALAPVHAPARAPALSPTSVPMPTTALSTTSAPAHLAPAPALEASATPPSSSDAPFSQAPMETSLAAASSAHATAPAPAPAGGMKRVRSLVEQLQDEERRIQRLKSPLGMDDGLGMDVVAPCAPTQPTGSSMHAEAVAVEERMELEDRALVEDRREEQLESSVGAAATSESAATMAPAKAEAAAADAASAPRGGSTASSSTLTMMVLDLQEAADHSMHIYGVLLGGGSALLNVSGFRNFFYLELRQLAAHPAATASTYPLADAGVLAAENDDERIAAMVVDALAADGQLKLGRSAASEQLAVRPVRRMPLLACYQHVVGAVAGTGRSAAALPTSAAALTVRLLRVEFAPPLKPKGLLEALGRAIQPADSPLRQHLQIDEQQQIVSFESQMTPAGTSALARRFAIEKDLAGGAWLTARNVAPPPEPLGSSCQHEFVCTHGDLTGHAPDILATADHTEERWTGVHTDVHTDERWTRLPRLSTLAVRVVSTLGHSEPQWEAGEGTSATVDGVRLISCESSTTDGGPPSLVVLAVASSSGVTTLPAANGVCGAQPIELRSFTSEAELLLAFERFVAEVDPDLLLTYDARCLGLVSTRHAELLLGIGLGPKPPKPAAHKGKVKAAGGGTSSPLQLGRQRGEPIKVVPMLATDCH